MDEAAVRRILKNQTDAIYVELHTQLTALHVELQGIKSLGLNRHGAGGYPGLSRSMRLEQELNSIELLPHISLNALSHVSYFQTMRVVGLVANQHELHILGDSGSTHDFLDVHVAKKLGCKISSTCPVSVTVAGGRELVTVSECKGFQWQLKGETFTADAVILPLGGFDMVLGIQWLATLGDIKCNFQELKMQFVYNIKKICLRGSNKAEAHWLDRRKQIQNVEIER
ncbi:omega-3 fatty acid desaturase, endoplasmic reticulum-like protein, partial [Tanacetum coccineum]